jgi:hypothetical protein
LPDWPPFGITFEEGFMTITFQKRQKEMKRLEKQREKAEKRAQRKLAKRAEGEAPKDDTLDIVDPGTETIPSEN